MAMPSSLKDEETGGGEGVPDLHDEPELLLAPGDTDDLPPHALGRGEFGEQLSDIKTSAALHSFI